MTVEPDPTDSSGITRGPSNTAAPSVGDSSGITNSFDPATAAGSADSTGIADGAADTVTLLQAWVDRAADQRARATVEGMQEIDPTYSLRRYLEDAIATHSTALEAQHHGGRQWRYSGRLRRGRPRQPRTDQRT